VNILVILNPAARGNKARNLASRIAALRPHPEVRMTSSPAEARNVARDAAKSGCDVIVAAGGDGTINSVVNGLAGTQATLGILPVGTMNVFATELGIPTNTLSNAWKVIEQGHVRQLDLPRAGSRHFVQLAGAGIDAEVVRLTSSESKEALGPLSYLLSLAQAAGRRAPDIQLVSADGKIRTARIVLLGNGRHYGGPFVLFKNARPDDGLLDVLAFRNHSPWDILRYVQAIAFGAHPGLPDVEYFQTRSLRLQSEQPVPVELDGELVGELPVRFGISRAKLRVLAPPPRSGHVADHRESP
jgi:YegS/Rv2252/BmrU family lipid kinase